ncbi:MAG TPA: MerR family transcriptional regulator [Candidatus Corynebacterium avicola]|uniref:MerR family transcriptional regulator n=1 Tax=Candidatus Corynebacterium avicola TaxID=2838527 RepID=A0A9D1RQP5_9CORY|nr:MerR family transcriptional regulator [Candidatus Corynebacterium avicola]
MLIGEVSRQTGVSVRMLRHYDRISLVSPSSRSSADYREYSRDDLHALMRVEALRCLGMSLAEVREALSDPGLDVAAVIARLREETRERIRAEEELLEHLDGIGESTPDSWDDVLRTTTLLTALREGSSRQRQAVALQDADSPTPPSVRSLVDSYLDEPDLNAAGALRWAIARRGAEAVDALASTDPNDATTRHRIAEALADIDLPQATAALEERLNHEDTRATSALALARRGNTHSTTDHGEGLTDILVTMVVEGDHDTEAAEALAEQTADNDVARADIVRRLLAAATPSASAEQRLRVVQALGDLPCDAARESLAHLTDDPDPRVAGTAGHLSQK